MTFIQALYGSQYQELKQSKRDPAKGRINGNIFLTAFIIVLFVDLFLALTLILPQGTFDTPAGAGLSGKTIGRLAALPVFALIYFVITKTIGTAGNYQRIVEQFNHLPEAQRAKANRMLLSPFFVLLGLMVLMMLVQVK